MAQDWFNNARINFSISKDGGVSQANNSYIPNYDFFNRTHFFFGIFIYDKEKSNNIAGCYNLIRKYVKDNDISSFFMIVTKIKQEELNK